MTGKNTPNIKTRIARNGNTCISRRGRVGEGRPRKFQSPAELEEMFDAYFARCAQEGILATIAEVSDVCGMDRKTFANYEKRDEFFPVIKKARMKLIAQAERAMFGAHPAGAIFWSKNNARYKDEQHLKGDFTLQNFLKSSAGRDLGGDSGEE